jgi:hypothetical protein
MSKQAFSSEAKSSKSKRLIRTKRSRQQTKKKKNDKNNNNQSDDDDEDVEEFHKLYIVMIFETLSTMSVMFAQTTFWILNSACFQHSIEKKSMFIMYTIFIKSILINDFEESIYVMKQRIIRVICKIDNKRTNIFFRRFLCLEMFFEYNQFWSIKRNSLFYVVQIEFIHDRESRHYNKKTRQQRVFF